MLMSGDAIMQRTHMSNNKGGAPVHTPTHVLAANGRCQTKFASLLRRRIQVDIYDLSSVSVGRSYGLRSCKTGDKICVHYFERDGASSIDRVGKNYKITSLEGRNQEKKKKYHLPHTGPAAAKRDRPPLDQQRNTDKITF